MVVTKHVLINVALEVGSADRVVRSPDAILEQAPEALDRVRVDVAPNIDLRRVVHAVMRITVLRQSM